MWFVKRSPIAIDFGDHAVKITQLENCRGELRVREARCVELVPSGLDHISQRQRMVAAANKALNDGSFCGRASISALRLSAASLM